MEHGGSCSDLQTQKKKRKVSTRLYQCNKIIQWSHGAHAATSNTKEKETRDTHDEQRNKRKKESQKAARPEPEPQKEAKFREKSRNLLKSRNGGLHIIIIIRI